ncbi:MAG TPA: type II toxin-antitoxin system VapC family toxin [Caulobacteraceae bacterium]|nr:type II toxin-antitoxin system VapC family toxin [Caulobacteraceae bacterium]
MIVVDTNVVSAFRRLERADVNFAAWARSTPATDLYLSVVTIQELETGVLLIERRDPAQGAMLRDWFESRIVAGFHGRVLPVDMVVARRCAHLHVPDRRSERDALIAATALVHQMPVATRNVADFAATGVGLINPWEYAGP